MHTRIAVVLILVFAFFGIADSAYLAQHELAGTPLLCNIANLSGCNIVAQSPYSHMFGIPVAVYGVVFYAVVFLVAAAELAVVDRLLRRLLQALAAAGLLFSVYATALQIFIISALCIYCLASAVTSVLIFAAASAIEPLRPLVARAPRAVPAGSAAPALPEDPRPPFTMPPQG